MTRGRKPLILPNDIKKDFSDAWWGRDDRDVWPLWIDDVVSGVARLDWYGPREQQVPLSTYSIIQCFLHLDEISTLNIIDLLEVKKRQAERYNKACRLCHPFLKRAINDKRISSMSYPNKTIISEEHGIALGYSPYKDNVLND